ncbi:uncharacterized protein [Spinacia oleracea]|uniref:Reverse transcriptase zinc-binding domain-containing protein n=1 Tax=Spinacia oleracea TaxID=3562 RepID=A0A9R0I6W7_SPIOL|nr:uncharacterized protein LOC110783609 [Spinacia oleracea]
MDTLVRRGMGVDQGCPRCGEAPETTVHMALLCEGSKLLWKLSPTRMKVQEWEGSFKEWCEEYIKHCKRERAWEITMMIIWQVWNVRNKWVFGRKLDDPALACKRSMLLLGEHEAAKIREVDSLAVGDQPNPSWKPPTRAMYKLNTDAAMPTNGGVGLGMVVRDGVGDIMMCAG